MLIFKNTYFVELLLLVTKDELFNLLLEYQNKFTTTLASIENDSGNLRKDFKKLSQIQRQLEMLTQNWEKEWHP